MILTLPEFVEHAKRYVETEAETKVVEAKLIDKFTVYGREDAVLLIKTIDTEEPEWWVVGGTTPTNLYSKSRFNSADEAFSFHVGIMARIHDRQFMAEELSGKMMYDAFICHASEDKRLLVRPLANVLTNMGYSIWYDEFELRVGDSLRRAIDHGLANSRFGIIVLSEPFFAKNWPQYELDGLTARELEGQKVILPIWYQITKQDLLRYSPSLANKVGLDRSKLSIRKIANKLVDVFEDV